MSRFEEIETALMERLRALKAKPEMTINMFDISVPLSAVGFTQDDIRTVLNSREQDKLVAHGPENRLAILKGLPRP